MKSKSAGNVFIYFLLLVALTASLAHVSTMLWGGKPEKLPETEELMLRDDMTVMEFGAANNIANPVMKEVLGLETRDDLQKQLMSFGLNREQLMSRFDKAQTLAAEHESKNWGKIPAKFGAWFFFLALVFFMIRKNRVSPGARKLLYLAAVVIFGVILGADPSPMGTVKDAIHLYGAKRVIFPPRMIALTVFLLIVLLANKFICAWGCQLGTLQDLIFRLNRNDKDTKGIVTQYKLPFRVTNGIRIGFFAVFTVIAFGWAYDIIDPIDPFKIYKPAVLGTVGATFIGALLVAGLFAYRPWGQLFCPFGLAGWLVEKVSIFRIRVDYETCIGCEACARACPSTVMDAILKQDRTIPDCFACGTCINVCPTDSISFKAGRRQRVPADKFLKKSPAGMKENEITQE